MKEIIMNEEKYDNICSIHRDNYTTRKEYINYYREYCKHYSFKAKVEGGWMFFKYATDYYRWKKQK